jgi:cyclomaltodextrin glucanotransferase
MQPFNDKVIYFILVDRFFNSDPSNDCGRNPLSFDAAHKDWGKYWGGDLAGVQAKLDYVQKLGASAIWLTPLFEQAEGLVDDNGRKLAAYHGYWARDFKRLDSHLVSEEKDVRFFASDDTILDRLIHDIDSRGMKLIFDVVCNHSNPRNEYAGHNIKGELFDDGKFLTSFENDVLGWYHHNGQVTNWGDLNQVRNNELCGLADFNEDKIGYRKYIKEAIKMWVQKGGHGLRVDTVKHMPLWFWQEFVSDMLFARHDLFMFGEWFQGGCGDPDSVEFANRSGMGMLDFALQRAITECLAKNNPAGFGLIDDVFGRDSMFDDCHRLVTFIDNHDMPRFMSSGGTAARQDMALAMILMARGTPCIYYGTEQYLHNDTDGGGDPYNRPMMERWDTDTPAFRLVQNLSRVRKENRAVQRGSTRVKFMSSNVYAFTRVYREHAALTVFNRGEGVVMSLAKVEFPDGVYKDEITGRPVEVRAGTIIGLQMPKDSVLVLSYVPAQIKKDTLRICFMLNGYATKFGEDIYVTGNAPELGDWDMAKAFRLEYVNSNLWMGDLAIDESAGKAIAYKFAIKTSDGNVIYENRPAHVHRLPGEGYIIWQERWC